MLSAQSHKISQKFNSPTIAEISHTSSMSRRASSPAELEIDGKMSHFVDFSMSFIDYFPISNTMLAFVIIIMYNVF
jgi:hypothetical protein